MASTVTQDVAATPRQPLKESLRVDVLSDGESSPPAHGTTSPERNAPSTPQVEDTRAPRATSQTPSPVTSTKPQGPKPWYERDPEEFGMPRVPRDRLPQPAEPPVKMNLWNMAKDLVGKASLDLHRISVPVYVNEPLTDMQRRVEGFSYSELLDEAAELPAHSKERMMKVLAFFVSVYSTISRADKPFKDLFGSTFDIIDPKKGLRVLIEKVGHHPPEHAMVGEGRRWTYQVRDIMDISLHLGYLQIAWDSAGSCHLEFDDGDWYTWDLPASYFHNLIMGKRYAVHRGKFTIKNMSSGLLCRSEFTDPWNTASFNGAAKRTFEVNAYLEMPDGSRVPGIEIYGWWNKELRVKLPNGSSQVLWAVRPPPPDPGRWGFSSWGIRLNELTSAMAEYLPPTDVRFRPDLRLFEEGYSYQANVEKDRLEEKQRQEREAAVREGRPWQARWFRRESKEQVDGNMRDIWVYKGAYWEAREARQWPADIRNPYTEGGTKVAAAAQPKSWFRGVVKGKALA